MASALMPWRRRHSEPIIGAIRGPARAYYQRQSGDFPKVSSTGRLSLSAAVLSFQSSIGRDVTVPVAEIEAVREQQLPRARLGGATSQMVVSTAAGEIGFVMVDAADWTAAVSDQLAARQRT